MLNFITKSKASLVLILVSLFLAATQRSFSQVSSFNVIEKTIKGKKYKVLDSKQLIDGYYKVTAPDASIVQFKVEKGKIVRYYSGKTINLKPNNTRLGWVCEGLLCTCDWIKEDCSDMLDGCIWILSDNDNITKCIKGLGMVKGRSKVELEKISELSIDKAELSRIHQEIQNQLRQIAPNIKCTNISGKCINSIEASCYQLACKAKELGCNGDYSTGDCKKIRELHDAGLCEDLAGTNCGKDLPKIIPGSTAGQKPKVIKITATIEKIYCRNAYDGKNDKIEEVYGWIKLLPGTMCYDGDTERFPPTKDKNSGNGYWELKPNNYVKLKKGQTYNINKIFKYQYDFPGPIECSTYPHQSIATLESNLDERDLPHDADDKLEGSCPAGYCSNVVYLNQVNTPGQKTFKFTQVHNSGGTILEVYFKVVVNSVFSNDFGSSTK